MQLPSWSRSAAAFLSAIWQLLLSYRTEEVEAAELLKHLLFIKFGERRWFFLLHVHVVTQDSCQVVLRLVYMYFILLFMCHWPVSCNSSHMEPWFPKQYYGAGVRNFIIIRRFGIDNLLWRASSFDYLSMNPSVWYVHVACTLPQDLIPFLPIPHFTCLLSFTCTCMCLISAWIMALL